jgi:hypothetical protein
MIGREKKAPTGDAGALDLMSRHLNEVTRLSSVELRALARFDQVKLRGLH